MYMQWYCLNSWVFIEAATGNPSTHGCTGLTAIGFGLCWARLHSIAWGKGWNLIKSWMDSSVLGPCAPTNWVLIYIYIHIYIFIYNIYTFINIYPSVYLSFFLSIYLSIYLHMYLYIIHISTYIYIYICICLYCEREGERERESERCLY